MSESDFSPDVLNSLLKAKAGDNLRVEDKKYEFDYDHNHSDYRKLAYTLHGRCIKNLKSKKKEGKPKNADDDDILFLNLLFSEDFYDSNNKKFKSPVKFLNCITRFTDDDDYTDLDNNKVGLVIKGRKDNAIVLIPGYDDDKGYLPNQKWHLFFSYLAGKIIGNLIKRDNTSDKFNVSDEERKKIIKGYGGGLKPSSFGGELNDWLDKNPCDKKDLLSPDMKASITNGNAKEIWDSNNNLFQQPPNRED